ncbi:MAG: hypothetical protein NTU83_12390 [Candidatus Hydrogenedentes bacterium]|nr:hypothetical protein [Candidatus Hydrogenedentota bacterium]
MLMVALMLSGFAGVSTAEEISPVTVSVREGNGYASFTNRLHPGNRIGYRFHEHTPLVWGVPPDNTSAAGINHEEVAKLVKAFAGRCGVQSFSLSIEDADWAKQRWTYYLAPVDDGIEMLWIVETFDAGLNGYYGVQ